MSSSSDQPSAERATRPEAALAKPLTERVTFAEHWRKGWDALAGDRVETPEDGAPPLSLALIYLRQASALDAQLYAQGYIDLRHTSPISWYGTHPFGTGVLVEIQEGGDGRAYAPALIERFTAAQAEEDDPVIQVVLETGGTRKLWVELQAGNISTLVLPESNTDVAEDIPRRERLQRIVPRSTRRTLNLAAGAAGISFLALVFGLALLPGASVVEIPDYSLHKNAPLEALTQPPPPDMRITGYMFDKGVWVALHEPIPDHARPSLAKHVEAETPVAPPVVVAPIDDEDSAYALEGEL